MPEVGEVAHTVANLRRNIVGFTIKSSSFLFDDKVFPSLKENITKDSKRSKYFYQPELKFTNNKQIEDSLLNKKVQSVGRHGKYFWMRVENILVLLHFGMTGWIKFHDIYSHFIPMESGGYKKVFKSLGKDELGNTIEPRAEVNNDIAEDWPPKFWKFQMTLEKDSKEVDIGFVDPRRFAKVRFYNITPKIANDELLLKNIEQLSKLGPDYSKTSNKDLETFIKGDPDPNNHGIEILNLEEFKELIYKKPNLTIKPFLLKQEYFSGIGNWMADEILFNSKIFPEDTLGVLNDEDIKLLYEKILEVSKIAIDTEGEVSKFPENWLMLYRWGKKVKKTFEGHQVKFLTVGGRTSCYVPEIQKKRLKRKVKDEKEVRVKLTRKRKVKEEGEVKVKVTRKRKVIE